jgi:hypothetical protein
MTRLDSPRRLGPGGALSRVSLGTIRARLVARGIAPMLAARLTAFPAFTIRAVTLAALVLLMAAAPASAQHGHDGGGSHPGSHPDSGGHHESSNNHPDTGGHHQDSGGHHDGGSSSTLHESAQQSHLETPNQDAGLHMTEPASVPVTVAGDLSAPSLPGVCADDPEYLRSLGLPITEQLRLACNWPEEWRIP